MKAIYLDTNIFVYSSQKTSPFFLKSINLLKYSLKNSIAIATRSESIQEIIHLAIKTRNVATGLKTANILLKLTQLLLPVDKETINIYLNLLKNYSQLNKLESRDFIHIASCLQYDIKILVTQDKEFKKFKGIKIFTAEEYLNQYKVN